MNSLKNFLFLGIFSLSPHFVNGYQAYLHSPEGGCHIQIESEQTLAEVEEEIKGQFPGVQGEEFFLEIALNSRNSPNASHAHQYVAGDARNYYAVLTPEEFRDIHYILTYLGSKPSLISLGWNQGDLQAAGDRIRHIHPLNWFLNVFRNEELKIAFGNIRGSGLWSRFSRGDRGIVDSLNSESDIHNMKREYIEDFSRKLGLESNEIAALIERRDWDKFFERLIAIPRKGDYKKFGD